MYVEEKIRSFGQKRDVDGLQNYMKDLSIDDLLQVIETSLSKSNFPYTWDYILQGFTTSTDCSNKRFRTSLEVVKRLDKNDYSTSHCNTIIRRLCMELTHFNTDHLIKLCDFCMECLQAQRVSQMSCKELLPEILNVINERRGIEINEEVLTGEEYKHQFMNGMCMVQWFPSNITPITEMFIDMALTKEEHNQVVNKLSKYLEKLTPQEIPSFTYQLLRLCKQNNSRIIFVKLQEYFSLRYKDGLLQTTDSDSIDFDSIENTNSQDIIDAESTVLFHIHTSASLGQECVKEYLNFLKNLLKAPEFILHPFQLSVLFTISTIPHYEERIFEIIRSCISRTFHEEQKRFNSAWLRDMIKDSNKVDAVFRQIINDSAQNRDTILEALVNFAFVLLGVGSILARDPIAEKQWQLGNMILFKIIKRKRHTASTIIEQLTNRVVSENSVHQYIECLYLLSKNVTFLMLENKSLIVTMMEGLVQMPGSNAKQLLDVIIPLTKVSSTMRDHFIILLRKALYSRNTETRQVAVIGFLKLLTHIKISNTTILSQGSYGSFSSGHSLFTQISLCSTLSQCTPSAFSNEALCLEILSILKRCFMQQAEVKVQLYAGLYDAVSLNPEIGIAVLEMLWMHFRDFYNIDEDTLPPLKFDKITLTHDVTVFLQEPLGNLIFTIALIVVNLSKTESDNTVVVRFSQILESICKRMINCEFVHFELDDGTDLTDMIIPEAQHKLLVLKEAMCVYEALIGYKIYSWELDSENNGKEIIYLFQGYTRLLQFLKNLGKQKKTDKKKKDANKTSQSIANTTIKKDGQKSQKNKKVPDTVLNFQVIAKGISLLHEPMVPWTTIPQANVLKTNKEFHQHMMQATFTLVSSLKNKTIVDVEVAKKYYGHLCEIAPIIYERIIKNIVDLTEFDSTTTQTAAECFLMMLNVVANNFKSNFQAFLKRISDCESDEALGSLAEFIKVYQKLFDIEDEDIIEDAETRKMSLTVLNTLHFLTQQVPVSKNALALQLLEWLKNYAVNNTIKSKPIAQAFINLLLENQIKFKVSLTFLENVSVRIGDVTGVINEEEHNVEEFKVLNELTVNNVWLALCSTIKTVLDDIDWIIARLKSEFNMINHPGDAGSDRRLEDLKSRERGVCCQLCFIVEILTNLSNCTVPTGNLSEAIFKNLSLIYNTLSSLTKYFTTRSSKLNPIFQSARFERLIKLAGKQLAPAVYKLISYVEESQKEDSQSTQKAKKRNVDSSTLKNRVLKETRLIPKIIYEIEQFSKFVIQLSKKTNVDLAKFIGQGTARDFRILHLKEVLGQANDGALSRTMNDSSTSSATQNEDVEEINETSPPPSKRRKNM